MARKLDVWLFTKRVCTLDFAGGNLRFFYALDWVVQPGAVALSNSLPLQARHWGRFAEDIGLTKAQARRRVLELARSLPAIANKLRRDPQKGFSGNVLIDRVIPPCLTGFESRA